VEVWKPAELGRFRSGQGNAVSADCFYAVITTPSVQLLFAQRALGSLGCVRGFPLESLSELGSLPWASSSQVVSKLREAYVDLARTFADPTMG
jgi:hypothetical protein